MYSNFFLFFLLFSLACHLVIGVTSQVQQLQIHWVKSKDTLKTCKYLFPELSNLFFQEKLHGFYWSLSQAFWTWFLSKQDTYSQKFKIQVKTCSFRNRTTFNHEVLTVAETVIPCSVLWISNCNRKGNRHINKVVLSLEQGQEVQ